jgi:hypothetical protein
VDRSVRQVIHATVYRGGRAPEPIAQDDFATWADFADELEAMAQAEPECSPRLSREEQKLAMLAIGPHRLREPYRLLKNVDHVTLLVIDVDRCNAEDVAERLRALEVPALMYASPSDPGPSEPDARRVRVVAPIETPIAVADCARTRFAFAELLGLAPGCGVEGAKDASRIFFAGRYHGAPEREVWRFGE